MAKTRVWWCAAVTLMIAPACSAYVEDDGGDTVSRGGERDDDDEPGTAEAFVDLAGDGIVEVDVDDVHVYWIDAGQHDGTARLMRRGLTGGAVETIYTNAGAIYGMAADAERVYLVYTSGGFGDYTGGVASVNKRDGAVSLLATGFNPTAIATAEGWVYYNEGHASDGAIWRVPATGGEPELVAEPIANPWALAVDGTHVYCAEQNEGRIVRIPASGGTPDVIASGWVGTNSIALDGDDVLFSACEVGFCTDAAVYRVPKTGGTAETVLVVPDNHQAKIVATADGVVWGEWLIAADGTAVELVPGQSTELPATFGVDVHGDEAFVADFATNQIFRVALSSR